MGMVIKIGWEVRELGEKKFKIENQDRENNSRKRRYYYASHMDQENIAKITSDKRPLTNKNKRIKNNNEEEKGKEEEDEEEEKKKQKWDMRKKK